MAKRTWDDLVRWASPPPRHKTGRHRRPGLRVEVLEGRALMAVVAASAFDAFGREALVAVYGNGQLYQYDAAGSHFLGNNIAGASIAFDHLGGEILDVVYTDGQLYQYDAAGSHFLGTGVESAAIAVDAVGDEISDIVYTDGQLYQYDAAGSHFLGHL